MTEVEQILFDLGVGPSYRGYRATILSVEMALANEDNLSRITYNIYRPVAVQCGCAWTSVERNLRTVALHAWRNNPELLNQISRCTLSKPPAASKFVELLYLYITRHRASN